MPGTTAVDRLTSRGDRPAHGTGCAAEFGYSIYGLIMRSLRPENCHEKVSGPRRTGEPKRFPDPLSPENWGRSSPPEYGGARKGSC